MGDLLTLAFTSFLVQNIILSQFLGICSFLGVSNKRSKALGMGLAVFFVITLSGIVTWLIYYKILEPGGLTFMRTIVFILVVAAMVQILEMAIKKFSPLLYGSLGVYLPLITTNCAVLGVAIDATVNSSKFSFFDSVPTFGQVTVYALGISIGYAVVIFLFSAIREEMDAYPIKRNWQGIPIALITAFIMAMIFIGFGGIV